MIVSRDIKKFVVLSESSLSECLKKISDNKTRIAYVVSEQGMLLGSLSDGDVRRWIVSQDVIDLSVMASAVMNENCISKSSSIKTGDLLSVFSEGIDSVPLLDELGRIHSIAFRSSSRLSLAGRDIGDGYPTYIIAEVGNNHQGDISLAKKLVDYSVEAGVDCVKFQMRNMALLYKSEVGSSDPSADLGAQYTMDLLERFQLNNNELFEIFDYCKSKGVVPLCTPWDLDSLAVLEGYGMPAYKVASADFTNFELLEAIARTQKPFFCSTGMTTEKEILQSVKFLDSMSANYVLLHCNSTYPTPFKDINLKYIGRLKKMTGRMVGYSGHERGIEVPIATVAFGSCMLEKHITVDRGLEGADHKVSLLPSEFAEMVRMVRNVEEALGVDDAARELTQGEMINRENLAKSLVASRSISVGEIITRDMIQIKSPGQGVQPNRMEELIGKAAVRNLTVGAFFYDSDIHGGGIKKEVYEFDRPFGVPVRYHDFAAITAGTNLDFVEFHLSYKDLELNIKDFFTECQDIGFAVHSPELFGGDHILDLCAEDENYRSESILHLTRVIQITGELKKFFARTEVPVIVLNAGGWDRNGFVDLALKEKKYELIGKSLNGLDLTGVQIAIQTMPPFPWHFGGQSFHNLFVCADEIVLFCKKYPKIKICLDVSHTMMACNYYGWDLLEFTRKIAPYNVHMHIVDAKGVDGEGVEVGEGDVDFLRLFKLLSEVSPRVQFIPEVWQGHKNNGEGFWSALDYLEQYSKVPL